MGRKHKNGIEYFPHFVNSGKTIFMLEAKFGNDGYAFWFKLLEILGQENDLFYDCNNAADRLFLESKCGVNSISATEILDLLASIEAIDPELWAKKVIWVQNFCDNVKDVFIKRKLKIPVKPDFCSRNDTSSGISAPESTQMKLNEMKVNNINTNTGDKPQRVTFCKPTLDEIRAYCAERSNGVNPEAWLDHYTSNGWRVGKNPMKDWKAAVRTWERSDFGDKSKKPLTDDEIRAKIEEMGL